MLCLLIDEIGQILYSVKFFCFRRAVFVQINGLVLFAYLEIARMLAYRAALSAIYSLSALFYPLFALFLSAFGADVSSRFESADELVCFNIRFAARLTSSAYYERGARLVDEYAVHLVDYRESQRTLYSVLGFYHHVVAQVIETQFAVGRIHYIAVVCRAFFGLLHAAEVAAYRKSEETEDLTHPVAMVFSEIFVDGDYVHAFARESVEICGKGRDEGLAFARLHLGNSALMQDDTADHLNVEMFHSQHAPARLSYGSERFGKQIVQLFARRVSVLVLLSAGGEFLVRHSLEFRLQRHDFVRGLFEFIELPCILGAEQCR